jgi:phage/plasmid-associated DNA primase
VPDRRDEVMSTQEAVRRVLAGQAVDESQLTPAQRADVREALENIREHNIVREMFDEDVADKEFTTGDVGNAEFFTKVYGDRVRFHHAWRSWLVFDGVRWVRDADGAVTRFAVKALHARQHAALGNADRVRELSRAENRIPQILALAKAMSAPVPR